MSSSELTWSHVWYKRLASLSGIRRPASATSPFSFRILRVSKHHTTFPELYNLKNNMRRIRLRPAAIRTRTGCQICRERRKGCDNARPTCGACKRLNLKCTYDVPLRWATTRKLFVDQDKRPVLQQQSAYDFACNTSESLIHRRLRQVLQSIGASQDLESTVFLRLCDKDQEILLDCKYRALRSEHLR
jgi:hypothetical protein